MASGNMQPGLDSAEHIGPSSTGDNIDAKKVANFTWDPTSGTAGQWYRQSKGLLNRPYNELVITYTDSTKATVSTIQSKLAGVAQQTITFTYPAANQDVLVVA